MAYHIDDRWLWLGFGAFAILAARGIRLAIADLVELTKIDPRPDPKKLPPEDADPEDRIPIETLKTLATSHNYHIAQASNEIIASRVFRNDELITSLIKDIQSADEQIRRSAGQAFEFLEPHEPVDLLSPEYKGWRRMFPDDQLLRPNDNSIVEAQNDLLGRRGRNATERARSESPGRHGHIDSDIEELLREARESRLAEESIIPSADDPVAGWISVPRERPDLDESATQEQRRRAHRQAVVIDTESLDAR